MSSSSQLTSRDQLKEFDVRLIVAGSRYWSNYWLFSKCMVSHVQEFFSGKSIVFITGKARSGADAMIIRWCEENGLPWFGEEPDWDKHGKAAGYLRNVEMAKIGNELVVFWDGKSRGTKHMLDIAIKRKIVPTTILIDTDEREPSNPLNVVPTEFKVKENHDQSESSRSSHSREHRETYPW